MKAISLIERSGISRSFKWISHISKHGNDRKCQVTSTRDVCAQTKARLSDSRAPDSAEEHRPSPARAPQLTPSCYFHVQRELATSSPPCSAMTSKLLFGYDHLSGNRPFPSLCLNRCSMLWSWGGGVLESELKAAPERACPLLVRTQKKPHGIMLASSGERFPLFCKLLSSFWNWIFWGFKFMLTTQQL